MRKRSKEKKKICVWVGKETEYKLIQTFHYTDLLRNHTRQWQTRTQSEWVYVGSWQRLVTCSRQYPQRRSREVEDWGIIDSISSFGPWTPCVTQTDVGHTCAHTCADANHCDLSFKDSIPVIACFILFTKITCRMPLTIFCSTKLVSRLILKNIG